MPRPVSHLLSSTLSRHCPCLPRPHLSFQIHGQKFPFFSFLFFCPGADCRLMEITPRRLGPMDSPDTFPIIIHGTRAELHTCALRRDGTLLDSAGCLWACLPYGLCRLPGATTRLSTGSRTLQEAHMEPASSKCVSTGMGSFTEMRIHSSTCANINTPGEQDDNGLHSFIHSSIRSFIHSI